MIRLQTWRDRIILLALLVSWFTIGWFARGLLAANTGNEAALVAQAGQVISAQSFSGPPEPRQLAYAAIRGMVNSLDDKYAVFWEPMTAARSGLAMEGSDANLGVAGEMRAGTFVITGVTPGQPAAGAGVQPGDVVTEVDGWQVKPNTTYMEVVAMLRGPENSTARLAIERGGQSLVIEVPRGTPTDIITRILPDDMAYIRLDRFTDRTPDQMRAALEAVLPGARRGLIWDLRYNGGGRMTATQAVLDFFLDEGMAFYGRTRDGTLIEYPTRSGDLAETAPLVVLVGPATYSAGETAAASVMDRGRATLIGAPTHGKSMFNATVPLADGSAIQLSVAQSLTPVTKTWYEGKGVPPNIAVNEALSGSDDPVLEAAIAHLRDGEQSRQP